MTTDTEIIKVNFGDWLFNAGILGFYRIITKNNDDNKPEDLEIGDNYISFKMIHLEGFSEKYFDIAFKQYGRFDRNKKELNDFIIDINKISEISTIDENNENKLKKIVERYKSIRSAELLDTKLKENNIIAPSLNDLKKDPRLFIPVLEKTLKILDDNYNEFYEADINIYLRWIYGQKSFLNNNAKKDRMGKFKKDFEEPILANSNKVDKKLICLNCCERKAKKDINFDTGLSPFLGVNTDSINYLWNFDPRIPLCEICELIYFCYFAGFTDIVKGKERKFYFVNSDSDFISLKNDNHLFRNLVKEKNQPVENSIPRFISESIIQESKKSDIITSNKILIELDLTDKTFPKVFSLNINKTKAEFIKDNINKITAIAKGSYSIKEFHQNLGIEFIDQVIKSKVSYSYLNTLLKYYSSGNDFYKCYFNYYHLQELNLLIFEYFKIIYEEKRKMETKELSQKELWFIYNEGIALKNSINQGNFKDEKTQNDKKFKSLAHKLLNDLRIGDTEQFLNLIMRTYMANDRNVPSIFIKAIHDKNVFYPIGYSFVNGLLGSEIDKNSGNKGDKENG